MSHSDKFPFYSELVKKFEKYLGNSNDDIKEALIDLTGDTYFEMRRMESRLMASIEKLILSGKYRGYVEGQAISDEDLDKLASGQRIDEDLKNAIKNLVGETWFSILNKQKVGIDKLFIALKEKD